MIFNRINEHLALIYPPAFLHSYLITQEQRTEINIEQYLHQNSVELIPITDEEQQKWGCSFVPLEPNVIIHYDISLNSHTQNNLDRHGVKLITFHPEALLAGGGSLRCLTLRIWRD